MPTYAEFLADRARQTLYGNPLVEMDLGAPGGGTETLRASLRGFRSTTAEGSLYYPRRLLNVGLATEETVWSSGQVGARLQVNRGEVRLRNGDGGLDSFHPRKGYKWLGREVRWRNGSGTGDASDPASFMALSDFGTEFVGELGEPAYSISTDDGGASVVVPIYGAEKRFEQPLSKLVYRGTGLTVHFAAGAYASCGTPAKLDLTGSFTWEGWLRADNLSATRRVIGWYGGTRVPFQVRVGTGGQVLLVYHHSGGTLASHVSSNGLVVAGRWAHVAVIVDGLDGLFVVLDGSTGEETVESFALAAATRDAVAGGATFQISFNSATESWVGQRDEDRVWTPARTLGEVREARNTPLVVTPAACAGHWKHDDGSGFTTTDSAASPANGTLNGTIAWLHSLEGDAALAGTIKPDTWGLVRDMTPRYVGTGAGGVGRVYQAAGGGPIGGFSAVREGGGSITLDTAHTVEKTFLETLPAAGKYSTLANRGMFILRNNPTLPVTCDGSGYNDPTFVFTAPEIAERILTTRGRVPLTAGEVNDDAFADLLTAQPAEVGIYIDRETTVGEAVDRVVGSVGAWWKYRSGTSELFVERFEGPAATAAWTFRSHQVIAVEPVEKLTRAGEVLVLFAPSYVRLTDDQVAWSSATPEVIARLRQEQNLPYDGWEKARVPNLDVIADYPDSRVHVVETYLDDRTDALAEASRQLAIWSSEQEPVWFTLTDDARGVSIGDTIAVEVRVGGAVRLDLDGTRLFYVLGVSRDPERGAVRVLGWG